MIAAAVGVGPLVGRRAVEAEAVVEGGAAGRHLDRHHVGLDVGRAHLVHPGEPVLGRVERVAGRQLAPEVRAARVVDGAGVGRRLVERHPAGRHVRRLEERHVGRVLVGEQRLARRRLPDHVVLQQPHARLARELGREARVALGERDVRQPAVGLPDVAQLPRAVGRRDARRVVDLVGREAGLPLVLEARVEALARALDLVVGEPVLDDQEAVAPVLLDLLRGRVRRRHA